MRSYPALGLAVAEQALKPPLFYAAGGRSAEEFAGSTRSLSRFRRTGPRRRLCSASVSAYTKHSGPRRGRRACRASNHSGSAARPRDPAESLCSPAAISGAPCFGRGSLHARAVAILSAQAGRRASRSPPNPESRARFRATVLQCPVCFERKLAMPKVLITDELSPAAINIFKARGIEVDFQPSWARRGELKRSSAITMASPSARRPK